VTVREDIIIHLSRHTFDEDEPEGMIRHQRKQINERERTWKVQVYYLTPKGRRFVEFL
jgi:hypothetical protein